MHSADAGPKGGSLAKQIELASKKASLTSEPGVGSPLPVTLYTLGENMGCLLGLAEALGDSVGENMGCLLGLAEALGDSEGASEGETLGSLVGLKVGKGEGCGEGGLVGAAEGVLSELVGLTVG